jgi:hypothetical protein
MRRLSIGSILAAALLAACHSSATPPSISRQAPSSTCVEGWSTPSVASPDVTAAVKVIRTTLGVKSPMKVVATRFFSGPESPPREDKAYLKVVDRWYVKARERGDPSVGGRFLVERRQFGIGLVAAAPFDTSGFSSDDWVGFQGEPGSTPQAVEGIPGKVAAVTYDFVDGGEGLDIPGLPSAVAGCMNGT